MRKCTMYPRFLLFKQEFRETKLKMNRATLDDSEFSELDEDEDEDPGTSGCEFLSPSTVSFRRSGRAES